jgi:hypothetical protein
LEGHHTEYTGILSALYVENWTLELIQRNILNWVSKRTEFYHLLLYILKQRENMSLNFNSPQRALYIKVTLSAVWMIFFAQDIFSTDRHGGCIIRINAMWITFANICLLCFCNVKNKDTWSEMEMVLSTRSLLGRMSRPIAMMDARLGSMQYEQPLQIYDWCASAILKIWQWFKMISILVPWF